ncbi:hypothetical protein TNCV_308831 [Trichonephila clavipes]|nr:hypothetical protein TNCV_308831 [Trichonephila clavipes]
MTSDMQIRDDVFTFIWRIQNFSYNSQNLFPTLSSPLFTFVTNKLERTKWILILKTSDDSMSSYIKRDHFDNGPETFTINFEIAFLAPDGSAIKSTIFIEEDAQFKRNSVIPALQLRVEVLLSERDVYLPQDVLTLQCKMWNDRRCCWEVERVYARSTLCTERNLVVQTFEHFSSQASYLLGSFQIKSKSKDWLVMCVKLGLIVGPDENEKIKAEIEFFKLFKNCKFMCYLYLLDALGKKRQFGLLDTRYGVSNNLSFLPIPMPFSKKELMDRKSEYLPRDELCLQLEFLFANGVIQNEIERTDYDLTLKPARVPTTNDFNNTSLSNSLYLLYQKQELCDIELKTQTSTFLAHKLVLCAVSSVFKSKLTSGEMENTSECIQMDDEILSQFLHFLYTGRLENIEWETACKLYDAGCKYDVQLLKAHCETFLMRALNTSNASKILVLAEKHRNIFLKDFVVDFILQHDEEIFSSDAWASLIQSNLQLALQTMLLKYRKALTT